MKSKLRPLKLSGSLIIALGDSEEERERYLMLMRKPHMSFQNSLVFPGGVCEKEDEEVSKQFIQYAKITALRETLEETGILILPPNKKVENLQYYAQKYSKKNYLEFSQLLISQWKSNLDLLTPIARFITPMFEGIARFDCYFYVLTRCTRINIGNIGEPLQKLNINLNESSAFYWDHPQRYLEMNKNAQIYLPPPQNLLLNFLKAAPNDLPKVTVEPMIGQISENAQFLLPGDPSYDLDHFQQVEPNSRYKQQIAGYLRSIKQKQTFQLRRVKYLSLPRNKIRPKQGIQAIIHPLHSQTSILAYLPHPHSLPASKL